MSADANQGARGRDSQGHRWFAAVYDRLNAGDERRLGVLVRPRIAGEAQGRVLEVGAGTGANFNFYPKDAAVVATEPDPFMFERAEKKLRGLGVDNIEMRKASVVDLPFDDASFDHVVCTLVLCSVNEQASALAEIRRVLKPTGTYRFLEHIRNDESRLAGAIQDAITPIWRHFSAGCHLNRRTHEEIVKAGFRIEWSDRFHIGPGIWALYGAARTTGPSNGGTAERSVTP
jgi:ubiquinone/menaquinone biosynthesis C-methylase UbiE